MVYNSLQNRGADQNYSENVGNPPGNNQAAEEFCKGFGLCAAGAIGGALGGSK